MVDLKRFSKREGEGLAKLAQKERDGAKYWVAQFSRFDIETGKQLFPEEQEIDLQELQRRRDEILVELRTIESIEKQTK